MKVIIMLNDMQITETRQAAVRRPAGRIMALLPLAAVLTLAGCGGAKAPLASHAPVPASPSPAVTLPALSRTQSLEMCAGLHAGILDHHSGKAYINEAAVAWAELKTVTGYQAEEAVHNAARKYCNQYVLPWVPGYVVENDNLLP